MPKPVLERVLGYLLIAAAVLGVLSAIGCSPGVEPAKVGDNVRCHFEGFVEFSVRGRLRMSFGFGGGEVRVSGGGLPFDLLCEVAPEGETFPPEV